MDNLDVRIIELNKGPEMGYYYEHKGLIKRNLIEGAFKIIGLLPGITNDFIKL